MQIDRDLIGKYALHSNGFGHVMRITGYDVDNNRNVRYKCEWKANCLTVFALFERSDLDVFLDMPAEPFAVQNEILKSVQ